MKWNVMMLVATLLVALGLSNCVIPWSNVEVIPGLVLSEAALLVSALAGLAVDFAMIWVAEVLGFFV